MGDVTFNINYEVRVKLTQTGLVRLRQYHERLVPNLEYRPPVIDQDGYTKFQLWDLMQVFGPVLYNGCDIPFETTILLRTADLKDRPAR